MAIDIDRNTEMVKIKRIGRLLNEELNKWNRVIKVGNVNALSGRNFAKRTLHELQSTKCSGYSEIDYLLEQIKSPDQFKPNQTKQNTEITNATEKVEEQKWNETISKTNETKSKEQ